jgi:hypothetical protein
MTQLSIQYEPIITACTNKAEEVTPDFAEKAKKIILDHLAIVQTCPGEEIWLPIEEFDGVYEVSNLSVIRRISDGRVYPKHVANSGYHYVSFWADKKNVNRFVHRLVALAFLQRPNEDCTQVNHIDGNKLNNNLKNLEWVTQSQNMKHSHAVLGNRPPRLSGAENGYSRPVESLCKKTGAVRFYPSISDAVKEGYRACCITDSCQGKQSHHRGLIWRYASKPLASRHGTAGGIVWGVVHG